MRAPRRISTASRSSGGAVDRRRDCLFAAIRKDSSSSSTGDEEDQPRPKMEKRDHSQEAVQRRESNGAGGADLLKESAGNYIKSMNLTSDQLHALTEFRSRVSGLAPEDQLQDHFLLQWLTARNFSVDKTEAMFRKSQDWRKELDLDHILEWTPPEVLVKYSPLGCIGFDKYGGTALIVPHGRVDIRGLLLSCSRDDYIRYTIQQIEKSKVRMVEESERRGTPGCQQTCIFDLEGFSIREFTWKPALDMIVNLMQVYEANYPELLRVAYVINAPKVFTIAYALIKPFLHEATISKVQIFGRTGWQEHVLKDIDAGIIPKHWGGTRVDPDGNEMCISLICMGGEVPKSYYLKNKVKSSKKNRTSLTVGKGGQERLKYEVTKANSILRWEFESDDYDIGFSIEREGEGVEPALPLVAPQRVNSHLSPEEGQLQCREPGTYVVLFDNSFSYMRSKKLHYTIEVLPPSGLIEE